MPRFIQKGKLAVIIDGQWGSTGKGLAAGYLATKEWPDFVMCNFSSNAGHTYIDVDGIKMMVQHVPNGFCAPNRPHIYINAGSLITPEILLKEISTFGIDTERVHIHPNAGVITAADRAAEAEAGSSTVLISSTLKGCGSAQSNKVMRRAILAGDCASLRSMVDYHFEDNIFRRLDRGEAGILETAQGFELSLNHGSQYPHVTSRDVTVMQVLAEAGVPPFYLGNVMMTLRTYPIRVGNVKGEGGELISYSGPCYPDQTELTWEEITAMSGSPVPLEERTTVTNKIRRIFTWSDISFKRALRMNRPTHLFINFVNYWNHAASEARDAVTIPQDVMDKLDLMDRQAKVYGARVTHVGVGPAHDNVIEVWRP